MREQPFYTIRPSAGGSFSYGWEIMKEYFLHLFLIVIIVGIANGPMKPFIKIDHSSLSDITNYSFFGFDHLSFFAVMFGFFALAYTLLFLPVIRYGAKYLYLQAVRGEEIDFKELINGFFRYTDIILANLLVMTLTGLGFVFCIIPGIICAVRFVFVPYLVMDKKLEPIKAVEESWRMTRGHGWDIFGMGILSIFIFILGLMCCFVGVFPALIWIHTSFASMYQSVLNTKENSTFLV